MRARVLSDFAGRWRINRRIAQAGMPPAQFDGVAEFRPDEGGLAYHETGALQVAGHAPMQAERRYFWDADLNVFFDDGRFFHRVPASGGEAAHWCDPDQYDVAYDFSTWPAFRVHWQVKGPRKDYRMESHYQPE